MVRPNSARRFRRTRLALLAALFLAGCGGGGRPALTDIGGVDDLRAAFNADAGTPRIVLLLSPT